MIFIDNKIYKKLMSIDTTKGEKCGVLMGCGIYIDKMMEVHNVSRDKKRFLFSFFDKFRIMIKIIFDAVTTIIIYHTHDGTSKLSVEDIESAISYDEVKLFYTFYLVINRIGIHLYRVESNEMGIPLAVEVNFEVK